jgi:hypothetical protein
VFEDTFAISLVRTLRPLVEHHPVIVASKSAATRRDGARWRADVRVDIGDHAVAGTALKVTMHASNTGFGRWRPLSRSGIGHVTCGVQLLDGSMRLIDRDYHRVPLPRVVDPGDSLTLTFDCPMPRRSGQHGLKFDLVAEGITWFETAGSTAVTRALTVT